MDSAGDMTKNRNITLEEFEAMARRGRIHIADEATVEPSKVDLNKA
jgi:hypothetical protein